MSTKLIYGMSSNKIRASNRMYLEIFHDHPLFDKSHVYLDILKDCLKHNQTGFKIFICYWGKSEDGTVSEHKVRDKAIYVSDLLEHSPEVKEYARLYFPEHAL